MTQGRDHSAGRVTVVDDAPDFLELMRLVLEPHGYAVTCIAEHATVQRLVDSRPDLMIIDLRLQQPPTELAGWDLIVLASHHAELHDVPIVVCSADLTELNERTQEVEGAERLYALAKPFELAALESLVQRLAHRHRAAHRRAH